MAVAQDELQIRLGLTVDGVQQARSTTSQLERRTTAVQTKAKQLDPAIRKLESRIAAVQKQAVKTAGKALVADAINQGLSNMTPNEDASAFSGLRDLGQNVAVNTVLLGGRAGPILGLIMFSISQIQKTIGVLDGFIQEDRAKFEKLQEAARERDQKIRQDLEEIDRTYFEKIAELREQMYQDLRNGY